MRDQERADQTALQIDEMQPWQRRHTAEIGNADNIGAPQLRSGAITFAAGDFAEPALIGRVEHRSGRRHIGRRKRGWRCLHSPAKGLVEFGHERISDLALRPGTARQGENRSRRQPSHEEVASIHALCHSLYHSLTLANLRISTPYLRRAAP